METAVLKDAIQIGILARFDGHRLATVATAYSAMAATYGARVRGTSSDTVASTRWYVENTAARPTMR